MSTERFIGHYIMALSFALTAECLFFKNGFGPFFVSFMANFSMDLFAAVCLSHHQRVLVHFLLYNALKQPAALIYNVQLLSQCVLYITYVLLLLLITVSGNSSNLGTNKHKCLLMPTCTDTLCKLSLQVSPFEKYRLLGWYAGLSYHRMLV